jgi:hypothetical protein
MKEHRENFFQQITGKVEHLNTIVPHGMGKKTRKRDLSISYWLAGIYKRSNSTLEWKIR